MSNMLKCGNCGASSFTDNVCNYCDSVLETPPPIPEEKIEVKRETIHGNKGDYDILENKILKGNMNDINKAINCVIIGNMNDIDHAIDCEIIGNMNDIGISENTTMKGNMNDVNG